jgi:hypothetical protein
MTPGRTAGAAYVLVVAAIAAVGFSTESTSAILLAGLLALPASVPAVMAYYVVYGLLAQLPGANPDSGSGSASCTPSGECHGSSTGDLATWFAIVTDVAGILALTVAAVLNVVFVRMLWRSRRGVRGSASASARTRSGA